MKTKTTTLFNNSRKIELDETTAQNNELLQTLKQCHGTSRRYRFFYGDVITGQSWNDEHDVMGSVSNSTGDTACLILIPTRRSMGGGALLDSCIIRIDDIKTKSVLYSHPKFHSNIVQDGNFTRDNSTGKIYSSHDHPFKARKLVEFMQGKRYSK
jgi:hypothetical protein